MTGAPVVCDSSPLIALAQIDRLMLAQRLFGNLVIPPAVAREIAPTIPRPPVCVVERSLTRPVDAAVAAAELGLGESEVLSVALELSASSVVLDELQGRRLARRLGVTTIGTLGLLLLAKRRGLLAAVRPEFEACGFTSRPSWSPMPSPPPGRHPHPTHRRAVDQCATSPG